MNLYEQNLLRFTEVRSQHLQFLAQGPKLEPFGPNWTFFWIPKTSKLLRSLGYPKNVQFGPLGSN